MAKYIITEDTIAGYVMWGKVSEYVLNGSFIVESKNGVRDVLKFLRSCDNSHFYYVIVDKVLDNVKVMTVYSQIMQLVANNPNMILLPIHSFEQLILSFELLPEWAWIPPKLQIIVRQFNDVFGKDEYNLGELQANRELLEYYKLFSRSSENVATSLLSDATANSGFHIVKGMFSNCWTCDCCGVDDGRFELRRSSFRLQCKLNFTELQKLELLVCHSRIKKIVEWLLEQVDNLLQ